MAAMVAAMAVMVMVENNDTSRKIRRLVRSFSDSSSTAELIVLISADIDLLTLSQTLMEQVDQGRPTELTEEIRRACAEKGVAIPAFFTEIRNVLQALHLQESPQRAEYAILGLEPEATWEEVKKAYRKLSIKYHPDRAGEGQGIVDRFIEISEAYHTLEKDNKAVSIHSNTTAANSWRKGHRKRDRGKQIRFFVTVFVVVLVLVLLSIVYTWQYRQKVYLQQAKEFAGFSKPYDGLLSKQNFESGEVTITVLQSTFSLLTVSM